MDFFNTCMHLLTTYLHAMATYLFDENGLHIIQWYMILIVIDTILGTVKSAKKSRLKSRTYLYGIFLKLLGILGIIVANGLDDMFTIYMQVDIGFDISDWTAIAMVGYESLSIVENMRSMGIFTGNLSTIINKYFANEDK